MHWNLVRDRTVVIRAYGDSNCLSTCSRGRSARFGRSWSRRTGICLGVGRSSYPTKGRSHPMCLLFSEAIVPEVHASVREEIRRILGKDGIHGSDDVNAHLVQFRAHRGLRGSHIGGHIVCSS